LSTLAELHEQGRWSTERKHEPSTAMAERTTTHRQPRDRISTAFFGRTANATTDLVMRWNAVDMRAAAQTPLLYYCY
jgi:hypothetical protein